MDKLPTNFFVGVVAGLTGAGIMWLCVGDWKERAGVGAADPESAKPAPASRIGMAEHYEPDAEFEKARRGAKRVDPKVPGGLAEGRRAGRAEARRGQNERPASNFASLHGGAADGATHLASWPTRDMGAPSAGAARLPMGASPAIFTGKANAGSVDDALSVALEAAQPYVESGFNVREDYWGGVMGDSALAISHQLFKGNEYWFWAGTDFAKSGIAVHVYDSEGNLAEAEHWKGEEVAAARVTPSRTGTYYLIVSDQRTGNAKRGTVHWAVAYGFR